MAWNKTKRNEPNCEPTRKKNDFILFLTNRRLGALTAANMHTHTCIQRSKWVFAIPLCVRYKYYMHAYLSSAYSSFSIAKRFPASRTVRLQFLLNENYILCTWWKYSWREQWKKSQNKNAVHFLPSATMLSCIVVHNNVHLFQRCNAKG